MSFDCRFRSFLRLGAGGHFLGEANMQRTGTAPKNPDARSESLSQRKEQLELLPFRQTKPCSVCCSVGAWIRLCALINLR